MRNISLDKLKPGETGYIKSVDMNKSQKIRLSEIGFTENTRVEALLRSPCGDPLAFLVKDTVVALRGVDAEKINVAL